MSTSVVVLGLPEAGKSSFIAATSHLLQFNEVPTVLTLDRLSVEDRYLFEMRAVWQNCEAFERTKGGPVHAITLHLKTKDGQKLEVFFPDIAGEEFEEQWRGREWSPEFTKAVSGASSLLLFINPIMLEKPRSKADVANTENAILGLLGNDEDDESNEDLTSVQELADSFPTNPGAAIVREVATQSSEESMIKSNPKLWNPRDADAQVKIVDILQSIASFGGSRRWTLGIVISAWDVVKEQMGSISPSEWLAKGCPFVSQYLESNASQFRTKIFGVSAQGGDPVKDEAKLRSFDSQSERVEAVYDEYQGHDLTRVLAWSMEADDI